MKFMAIGHLGLGLFGRRSFESSAICVECNVLYLQETNGQADKENSQKHLGIQRWIDTFPYPIYLMTKSE